MNNAFPKGHKRQSKNRVCNAKFIDHVLGMSSKIFTYLYTYTHMWTFPFQDTINEFGISIASPLFFNGAYSVFGKSS